MAEISDAQMAEYEQLKALSAIKNSQQPAGPDEVDVDQLTRSRALLADGTTHDYPGAHPTHVDNGAGRVPVLAVYNV